VDDQKECKIKIMNNMEDLDYIKRRDELVRTMQKQNLLAERDLYNEERVRGKRGRKPAPSKKIVNYDVNKPRNSKGNKHIYHK
jgi:hypothetical protein